MKKYQDELQRFSLSEEDKAVLKQAVLGHEESSHLGKHRRFSMRYVALVSTFAILILGIGLYGLQKEESVDVTGNVAVLLPELQSEQKYTPQSYFVGGLGAAGGAGEEEKTGSAQSYPYGGLLKEQQLKTLPVYELHKASEEVVLNTFQEILNKFEPNKQRKLDSVDHYEDEELFAYRDATGTFYVQLKTPIEVSHENDPYVEEYRNNVGFMMEHVDTYVKQYLSPLGFHDVTYSVLRNKTGAVEILISQAGGNAYDDELASNMVTFRIDWTSRNGMELALYPIFSFKTNINNTLVDEYPIYTQEEATSILLRGGYYWVNAYANNDFSKEDILYTDLVYESFSKSLYEPTELYKVPCYRFYVHINGRIEVLDVIATQQTYLRTLDQMTWYMDK